MRCWRGIRHVRYGWQALRLLRRALVTGSRTSRADWDRLRAIWDGKA